MIGGDALPTRKLPHSIAAHRRSSATLSRVYFLCRLQGRKRFVPRQFQLDSERLQHMARGTPARSSSRANAHADNLVRHAVTLPL